jgi:type VI secretion system secreted protein VgrG
MPSYSQDGRPLAIETPLGKDKLLLEAFDGEEILGDLFVFRLVCLSVEETLSDSAIVGKQVSFRVNDASDSPRWFTGYVSRFSWIGRDDDIQKKVLSCIESQHRDPAQVLDSFKKLENI